MKRGSALLIVLGMISFMVVSAVAFSAYMRTSRLPSSYLRRTSSSRQLVKAALAEAIDRIDVAIGNDPFPGMGTYGELYDYPRTSPGNASGGSGPYRAKRNYWWNHCFIGTNELVAADETVSTLTLEALAYLPPALINEARYYSRHAATARWESFGFDVGRYAFFAVDVSDHLDVNRIAANVGRNSSDNGRISLAYVFEDDTHTGYPENLLSRWDAFMNHFVDAATANEKGGYTMARNPSKLPLVSLADLNLAIGYGGGQYGCPSQVVSPFCRFLATGDDFVKETMSNESKMMRNMAFVTDSYLPAPPAASRFDYDLNDPAKQPFRATDLQQTARSVWTAMNYSSDGVTRLVGNETASLCGLGLCALWDYLDEDSVPLSLAIPTTERVPMFAAVQPVLAGNPKLTVTESKGTPSYDPLDPCPDDVLTRTATRVDRYMIDASSFTAGFQGGKVETVVTFPFRRDGDANGSFMLGGRVALFFSDPAMGLHTGNPADVLHLFADGDARRSLTDATVAQGVFCVPLSEQSLTCSDIDPESEAVKQVLFDIKPDAAGDLIDWLERNPMFTVTREWTQTRTKDPDTGALSDWTPAEPPEGPDATKEAICNVPPLTAFGVANDDYLDSTAFLDIVKGNRDSKTVKLQMCVWLYAKDAAGNYVDLVPACLYDDDDLNGSNHRQILGNDVNAIGGMPYPLLRFGGMTFDYKPTEITTRAAGLDFGFGASAIMCADPRWNWAPEHWFVMPGGVLSEQNWLSNCQRGTDGRDRDIFMATSDAGYLQSVYELAFLPRLTDLKSFGQNKLRGDMESLEVGRSEFAANFSDTLNKDFAWRTYRPFAVSDGGGGSFVRDDFEGVGFTSEGTGFRVNPYAASDSVLLAALANTPYNWMVASTNTTAPNAVPLDERKAETFNRRYCFNEQGADSSKFAWGDLTNIVAKIRKEIRKEVCEKDVKARTIDDWKDGFDSVDWGGVNSVGDFAGVTLSLGDTCALSEVDRKFLYGYWRDCFAAKQQLFLVFVRAEPTMMGGGAVGQTPPQLGARAVALVWRDPAATQTDVGASQPRPHRTRVLFYRQFD